MQVSWMRKRDLHILTAGVLTYTSDQRFQVIHPDNSDNWTLLIKFAQPRDAGIYECQVNTEPKMSLAFQLNVVGEYEMEVIIIIFIVQPVLFEWIFRKVGYGISRNIGESICLIMIITKSEIRY